MSGNSVLEDPFWVPGPGDWEGVEPVYRGPGWIGDGWSTVDCFVDSVGYRITVSGAGSFLIDRAGCNIARVDTESGDDQDLVVQTVLGPALILALALQGTWCLHASAVAVGGGAVAFAGESGNGKSTLAAFLGEGRVPGWQHLVDDVLPVETTADGLEILPHFPQLKLPPHAQLNTFQPERIRLRAIYQLSAPEIGQAAAEIRPLPAQEAVLVLVRHTVAARLFDRELLARHMAFCATAAACVPVRRLAVPRDLTLLPRVHDLLVADLESVQ